VNERKCTFNAVGSSKDLRVDAVRFECLFD